jgi:effector-binding domain-containing protein
MFSDPKIIIRPAQPFAAIQLDVSRAELPQHAPQLIDEVAGWLGRRGAAPVGAPFFSYLRMYGESMLDMEAGFFTSELLQADERVRTAILPGGRYAMLRYTGPYDHLYEAHMALGEWLGSQGINPMPESAARYDHVRLEHYETDPADVPDPANWITDVAFRLGD